MTVAYKIINMLGGIRPLARELGIVPHTIVQGWKDRGTIPTKYWPAVSNVAMRHGFKLTADHFAGLAPLSVPEDSLRQRRSRSKSRTPALCHGPSTDKS
jgi:hypothetical protein